MQSLSTRKPALTTRPRSNGGAARQQVTAQAASAQAAWKTRPIFEDRSSGRQGPLRPESSAGIAMDRLRSIQQDGGRDVAPLPPHLVGRKSADKNWLATFFLALRDLLASVFAKKRTIRSIACERLQACLSAERFEMSEQRMLEVKAGVVDVLSKYVHISDPDAVTMQLVPNVDEGAGRAFYTVSVPITRVRHNIDQFLHHSPHDGEDHLYEQGRMQGVELEEVRWDREEWDENDFDSDPSSRFPCGA